MAKATKTASPKADKIRAHREQSLENAKKGNIHGKQNDANKKRISGLKSPMKKK